MTRRKQMMKNISLLRTSSGGGLVYQARGERG